MDAGEINGRRFGKDWIFWIASEQAETIPATAMNANEEERPQMTVTLEFIGEQLKRLQDGQSRILSELVDIKADNRAHRSLTTGLVQASELQGNQIAEMQARLDRIERRLDLVDAPAE